MKNGNHVFIIWLAITLAFMFLIFTKSNEPYKEQDMKPFLKQHIQLVDKSFPRIHFYYDGEYITSEKPYDFVEFFIRKAGHVTEYAILTFLWVKTLSALYLRNRWGLTLGVLLSFLYACSDEWHQSFIQGRTGHPIDVFVPDLFGILLVTVIFLITRNTFLTKKDRA